MLLDISDIVEREQCSSGDVGPRKAAHVDWSDIPDPDSDGLVRPET